MTQVTRSCAAEQAKTKKTEQTNKTKWLLGGVKNPIKSANGNNTHATRKQRKKDWCQWQLAEGTGTCMFGRLFANSSEVGAVTLANVKVTISNYVWPGQSVRPRRAANVLHRRAIAV